MYPNVFRTERNVLGEEMEVGGVTQEQRMIIMNGRASMDMNEPYDSMLNRIHEIFHTFGMKHSDRGNSDGIHRYPPAKPNNKDMNRLMKNKKMPIIKR